MKKLIALIMFMFLVLPLSANAGQCERYWDELTSQCFEVTVDDINYTACFSDSYFGPCPGGIVILSYVDIQIIDEIEYVAQIDLELHYVTNPDVIIIEDVLEFILVDGKLILLPEDPLIFNRIEKENLL